MNYITIDGELVTPKTEAMAYEQTNHRMDTLEQNIQNDFAGVRQEITETVNSTMSSIIEQDHRLNRWSCSIMESFGCSDKEANRLRFP